MKISSKGSYYGDMKSEWDAGGILLSEYDYVLPATDWHFHENPYFMYVLQGDVYDINKKRESTLDAGSLIFHNWQEPHWNKNANDNTRGFHIEFERKWFENKKLQIDLWEGSQEIRDPRVHHLLAKIYSEFKCQDAYSLISVELLLLELCENMENSYLSEPLIIPSWIEELKDIVHSNRAPLDLDSLSRKLGVHPVHISRAVPKYLSTTLGQYIREQKVKRSLVHLMAEDLSLTEIAYLSGFSDQSHYIKTFKSFFQMTPKDYRKKLK